MLDPGRKLSYISLVAALAPMAALGTKAGDAVNASSALATDSGLNARPRSDEWEMDLRVNGWLPSLNGTVGVEGVVTSVELPISDILDHLDMTFQTSFAAQKGRWGFTADFFTSSCPEALRKTPHP